MRFPEVNCLRGIAILAVLFCHLFPSLTAPHHGLEAIFPAGWAGKFFGSPHYFFLGSLFTNAWIGVNLFFVLSGFVLYLPYAQKRREMNSATDARSFYKHRCLRLMPLLVVNIIVLGLYHYYTVAGNFSQYIQEVTLVSSGTFVFVPSWFQPPSNFVLWSLGIEIWFSILFVPLCLLIRRDGAMKIGIVVFVMALVIRVFGACFLTDINPYLSPTRDSIVGRLDDFFVGMFVAILYAKNQPLAISARTACTYIGIGVLLVWTGAVFWDLKCLGRLPAWSVAFFNVFFNIGFGFLLWGCICARNAGGKIANQFLQNYPLQLFGMMCYSIYIWHAVMLHEMLGQRRNVGSIVTYLAVLLLVSVLSYRFIEFNRVKNWRDLLPKKRFSKPPLSVCLPVEN